MSPLFARIARIFILLSTTGVVAYITLLTTIGVVSKLPVKPVCTSATGTSEDTLPALISVKERNADWNNRAHAAASRRDASRPSPIMASLTVDTGLVGQSAHDEAIGAARCSGFPN